MGGEYSIILLIRDICNGETNHAEVIEIYFDEKIVSFKEIIICILGKS